MTIRKVFTLLALTTAFHEARAQGSMESNVKSMEDTRKPMVKKYDKILSVSPIQFTENGVGFGISFEQRIDREGIVAYNLPIIGTYRLSNNNQGSNNADPMYYFMPGIKFYPTGSLGKVKYAIGPSIVAGIGKRTDEYYAGTIQRDKFLLGVMINNSLNLNVTRSIYMGMEFGFGFTYIRKIGGISQGMGGLAEGGFKIGYRF